MSIWAAATALLVIAGIVASVLGAKAVARSDADKAKLSSHLASAEIASTLKLAIEHEEDLVVSASAFVSENPHVSAAEFDVWAESVHAMQRYKELQDIGLVQMVPARHLTSFQARMAAHPLRPLGPHSLGPVESPQVLPAGTRPFYCLAVAGLSRDAKTYLPGGLDYCALAPSLVSTRETGLSSYAPFAAAGNSALAVETPVYRGGTTPATVAERRGAFLGWIGELLVPKVVLGRALEGHPHVAVTFHFDSTQSHVAFTSGTIKRGEQSSKVNVRNGWSLQSFSPRVSGGVAGNWPALTLLIAGTLVSLMFGLLGLVLGTSRRRALALVREKTRELSHQALHDTLTGLPNRALVLDRAAQLLARSARRPGVLAGALFIDIDGFKHVNDSLGHAAGDQLLKTVGERLQGAVRDHDTVGRLGGDEFVVLVDTSADERRLDLLADRLTEVLREPVALEDGRRIFSVTASIGVAMGQYATPDGLLRDADLALYAAKAAGKDRYALFDASMYAGAEGRLELESDLGSALAQGQFFLLYQPIFALPRQRVVGVEALIRWRHPERGVVPPDSFIPLAEESGLIVQIGRWVLEEACRQAAAWTAEGLELTVAVNVSAHQLSRRGFAEDVRSALASSGIRPSLLTLELTETTLMRDVTAAGAALKAIKALGVRIAIDDFGTGYASLSQLQRLPVDILKIDRSFVAALGDGGQSRELLQAILGVGEALSLTVVAEGIEEAEQMATLEEMGCEMAQGFLMGKPGPAEEIESITAARTGGAFSPSH
ncbi:MAG TPA: EAL domain-containing protein [Solirubrobacteraceae bacterium]|jgi:diguanylate cyclase (GGDEF)-like protein|nr:EAL domain-containing protein [Solirubrobacteraceae bacterium]